MKSRKPQEEKRYVRTRSDFTALPQHIYLEEVSDTIERANAWVQIANQPTITPQEKNYLLDKTSNMIDSILMTCSRIHDPKTRANKRDAIAKLQKTISEQRINIAPEEAPTIITQEMISAEKINLSTLKKEQGRTGVTITTVEEMNKRYPGQLSREAVDGYWAKKGRYEYLVQQIDISERRINEMQAAYEKAKVKTPTSTSLSSPTGPQLYRAASTTSEDTTSSASPTDQHSPSSSLRMSPYLASTD